MHTLTDLIQRATRELSTAGFLDRAARAARAAPGVDAGRVHADTRELQRARSTREFIQTKQSQLRKVTLHATRLQNAPSTPHTQALQEVATRGARIIRHAEFSPNKGVNPVSYSTPELQPILTAHAARGQRKGHTTTVRTDVLREACTRDGLDWHVNPSFILPKPNDELGREATDLSCCKRPSRQGPNHKLLKTECAKRHGEMRHATLADQCQAMVNAERVFGGGNVVGMTRDVRHAHKRIWNALETALLCCVEVDSEHTALALVAHFGPQVSPFVFDPVTRTLKCYAHNRHLAQFQTILGNLHSDDYMAFGSHQFCVTEAEAFERDATMLLGDGAVAADERGFGPVVTNIGWVMNCYMRVLNLGFPCGPQQGCFLSSGKDGDDEHP